MCHKTGVFIFWIPVIPCRWLWWPWKPERRISEEKKLGEMIFMQQYTPENEWMSPKKVLFLQFQ